MTRIAIVACDGDEVFTCDASTSAPTMAMAIAEAKAAGWGATPTLDLCPEHAVNQQVSEVPPMSGSTTKAQVPQIVDILSRALGELTVDQQASTHAGDGSVQMLTIRYHRALGSHAGASFRTRVARVLNAKVPVPHGHWQMQWGPVRNELRMRAEVDQPDDATNQEFPGGERS